MADPGHESPPSSNAPSGPQARGLAAWRFDVGRDAYALLELPATTAEWASGRLTRAEREVVRLIAAGMSNAELGRRRGSSPRTVANQAARIFR